MDTADPDLSDFAQSDGKLVVWHGLADNEIFPQGTEKYFDAVFEKSGGRSTVDEFARLFLAPGVGHCRGGSGPAPADPLSAVVDWVENGIAPDTLTATTVDSATKSVTKTVPLCPYPAVTRYNGTGDPNSENSYTCA